MLQYKIYICFLFKAIRKRMTINVVLIRIDDRYIHGQVTYSCVKAYNINEIWVISDKVFNNPILKQIQITTAPVGVKVQIFSVEEACKRALGEHNDDPSRRIFLIFDSPKDLEEFMTRTGIQIDTVFVGSMAYKDGKKKLTNTVYVSEEDIRYFKLLISKNVKFVYQQYGVAVAAQENLNNKLLSFGR
jgi:mannose/fructose/N-acetylgalactosamine-specific phosphotransferase system component IIB